MGDWISVPVAAHDDVPCFVVENLFELPTLSDERWVASATGGFSGADLFDRNFPISNTRDRFFHKVSKPTISGTAWSLLLRANTSPGGISGNVLVVGGHNLSGASVKLQTANDDAFTSGLATIKDFGTLADNKRLLAVLSDTWTIERARLVITSGGAFTPEIGELWFGPRLVLPRDPDLPWDDKGQKSDVVMFKSKGGIITEYSRFKGQRFATLTTTVGKTDAEVTTLRDIFKKGDWGGKKILFVEKPNTAPVVHLMHRTAMNVMNLQGPYERQAEIEMEECAPFWDRE